VETEKVLIDIANRFYSLDDKVTVTTLDTYNSLDQLPSHSGECVLTVSLTHASACHYTESYIY